jgi:DNA-binding MarR family transcriptional regulator
MGTNGSIPAEEFIKSLHLFTHLARHNMENRFVEQVSGGEITFVQMNLMNVLGKYPGRTVGDVAKFMNVSYPAATKTIDNWCA